MNHLVELPLARGSYHGGGKHVAAVDPAAVVAVTNNETNWSVDVYLAGGTMFRVKLHPVEAALAALAPEKARTP